jgi:soluble lytic murein transglycosylase-like protein
MKLFAAAAALALLCRPAMSAQPPGAPTRLGLLGEIEAWRATQLPHTNPPTPLTVKFEGALDQIKREVQAASDAAALSRARRELDAWEKGLLGREYADAKSAGLTRDSFERFAAQQGALAQFSADLHAKLAAPSAAPGGARRSMSDPAAAAARFDGSAQRSGNPDAWSAPTSVVVAPPLLDPRDPARYAKVRAVLLSQGVNPRVVKAAIEEAIRQNADPLLVLAMIRVESRFKQYAVSPVGARGLMQIMPSTGRALGVWDSNQLYDVGVNLRIGIGYANSLFGRFTGSDMTSALSRRSSLNRVKAAIAAYNAGPYAVKKYRGVPPYQETMAYVDSILGYYAKYKQYLSA